MYLKCEYNQPSTNPTDLRPCRMNYKALIEASPLLLSVLGDRAVRLSLEGPERTTAWRHRPLGPLDPRWGA